jgi:hypothetical protein
MKYKTSQIRTRRNRCAIRPSKDEEHLMIVSIERKQRGKASDSDRLSECRIAERGIRSPRVILISAAASMESGRHPQPESVTDLQRACGVLAVTPRPLCFHFSDRADT